MAKGTKFTDPYIKNLKPKDKEYTVRESEGFTLRVLPSGVKTWYYTYTFEGSKRRLRLGQGNYPDVTISAARRLYEEARVKVANGIDVKTEQEQQREERRKAPTVSDLVKDYIERHAKRKKRSWAKDEAILNRDVVPRWGKIKAQDITKGDVQRLLEEIIYRGAPGMANNCFQIIRKMFNWAVEQDCLKHSPCMGVPLPSAKQSRKRALTEAEIKTLWENLDKASMSDEVRRALKLTLVTAQRPGEVLGIHTDEIEDRWWTLPVARQKVSKVKESDRLPHRVYLTDLALDLLGELEVIDEKTGEKKRKGYIFKTPHTKKNSPMGDTALAVAVGRALAAPVLDEDGKQVIGKDGKPVKENKLGIEHFTPHDLRRTARTLFPSCGIIRDHAEAVLNHVLPGMSAVYDRYHYDPEKQAALEAWERKLTSIINPHDGAQVIPINRKKAS